MPRAPAWISNVPVAHRGLHDEARPENSMAAFAAACDRGFAIELDVHASVDGEAVVFHDETLERLTSVQGRVQDTPWHRLREMTLCGTPERIPHLREVLASVRGRVPVVVEVKNDGPIGVIERAVERALSDYGGPFAVQSFNPFSVAWFRERQPTWIRGMLAGDLADAELWGPKKFALRHLLLAGRVRPHYVGFDLRSLPSRSTTLARRMGVPVLAWTVRTAADLQRAQALADNVIFETVDPGWNAEAGW